MTKPKLAVLLLVLGGLATAALVGLADGPARAGQPPDLEEFVPSEELPSDSAVAFPVDI